MSDDVVPLSVPPVLEVTRAVQTGNVLKLHDAEVKLMNSGSRGMQRLAAMRAQDLLEQFPNMSESDAGLMGKGYVVLKIMGMNGQLTETTQAEVQRLENK
ncbi:hypothetical protein NVR66_21765 [Enterobacter bugandensis]|uniref:hypothetical protein n=1 Tax=Enterobacter bugandensis TaxID=881260 RepID=UPI0023B17839|nr:hypothetical protein [Enterobacter bugandensis]MDE7592241.1 hypothetical protein [Enterobacter bugandensis]